MLSASEAPTKPTAAVITTPAVIIVARVILECLGASDWLDFDVDLSFLFLETVCFLAGVNLIVLSDVANFEVVAVCGDEIG